MSEATKVRIDGQEVVTPEEASAIITDTVGAEFSVRQVDRLGDSKILEPILFKRRRFYRRRDVDRLLKKGAIAPSAVDPEKARLRRAEYRERHL